LAITYSVDGQFDKAVNTAQRALNLASAAGADDLAGDIRRQLELYRQGKPYSEPNLPAQPK
jgi:hypothetical protein